MNGATRRDLTRGAGAGAVSNLTSNELGGVKMAPPPGGGPGQPPPPGGRHGPGYGPPPPTTVNYITNINYCNGWNNGPGWGWGGCYQPAWNNCWTGCGSDAWSFAVGFGTGGFSFGLFYGAGNVPFCSSWCDPWWDGWCGYVSVGCAPSVAWRRPCWSPCGPWWSSYVVYQSYPTWCVPVYEYTPVCAIPSVTYVNYYTPDPVVTTTVYAPPTAPPPAAPSVAVPAAATSAAEAQAWDLLANGFPRSAAETFAQMHDADSRNLRSLVGYALSLAMLDDMPASAGVLRQAVAVDPTVLASLPLGPMLSERIRLLEQSAEVASRQASMAQDALFDLAAWRTMLGDYTAAHFAVVAAQQQGDTSPAAANLRAWLEPRLRGTL